MKFTTQISATLVFILLSFSSLSITYTSMNNGNWNDVVNVWSTDGGMTPCGCNPGPSTFGNNVTVNHDITLNYNIVINNGGSTLIVSPGASLSGPFNLNTWDSNIDIFGNLSIAKYVQDFSSNTTIHTGAIMTLTNRFIAQKGVFTIDGGLLYMTGGNFDIGAAATFNVINNGRVTNDAGNIENNGTVFIETGSCMTTRGNWKNTWSGTVTGGGSATTIIGNMQNNGIWDVALVWCSAGADFGMPSPEDCASANSVCGAIVLPIELVYFEANAMDDYIVLDWETATETDNDYFRIEHSTDGNNWRQIAMIDGAGTSIEAIKYEYFDYEASIGVNYYRLVQVDFSGRESESKAVYATLNDNEKPLFVYPNPTSNSSSVTVRNVENGDNIQLIDASGNVIAENTANSFSNEVSLDISGIRPGVYFVTADNVKGSAIKLMITQ